MYEISEVDGILNRDAIERLNGLEPTFPPLVSRHLTDGFWWLAYHPIGVVAFAGMVPFGIPGIGYLKRCYIAPAHRGHGLQYRLMTARIMKAQQLGWASLVSDCHEDNEHSANNFRRAGFTQIFPDQPWYPNSLFWAKSL